MNIAKIGAYNNYNKYFHKTSCNNSQKQTANQFCNKGTSFENQSAADAIKVSFASGINFLGHAENLLIWKPSDSEKRYNAKLEHQKHCQTGISTDAVAYEVIRRSGVCAPDARIYGHVEDSDIDYFGPQIKSVYFTDPDERVYSAIKSSYDYVVYAPESYDDEEELYYGEISDTVADWESYAWIDQMGPSWL